VQLVLIRSLASATSERVYVFGRELHWECWFRQQFSFPCPTCGLTRGVLLTLHGHVGAAFRLNPTAPLLVCGLIAFAVALLCLAAYRQRREPLAAGRLHGRIRMGATVYGWLFCAALLTHWLALFFAR